MKPRYFSVAVAACTLTATVAMAQTTSTMPANPPPSTAAAPVPGANSFTESEARNRIEARGFSNITALKKDQEGIWRGSAMKDGKTVSIALDFKGNVTAE